MHLRPRFLDKPIAPATNPILDGVAGAALIAEPDHPIGAFEDAWPLDAIAIAARRAAKRCATRRQAHETNKCSTEPHVFRQKPLTGGLLFP